MNVSLDNTRRQFINRYQGGFPLDELPYSRVADDLGIDAATLISMIKDLLDEGSLSRFGPLYDATSMGGGLTLAALSVAEDRFDDVAQIVNDMPEVAHNYQREHELNMWFVIATETPEQIPLTIDRIEQKTNLPIYNFPKLQTFYLGLWLKLEKSGRVTTQPVPGPIKLGGMMIDELDYCIVRATQNGLPLQIAPYSEVASQCNCDTKTVLQRMSRMLDRGVIRRIGAIPNHYNLGLRANGMSVWDIDDDKLNELGARVGRLDFVSHCYARPRRPPTWNYNLFAMIHGHDRDEVMQKREQISELLGSQCRANDILFSSKILKKTGLRLVA